MKRTTLCYFIDQKTTKVLLGKKLRGRGMGKFNGYGGKSEIGESDIDCLNRECQEEARIIPINPIKRGKIVYSFFIPEVEEKQTVWVDVFTCSQWSGRPVTSDEMEPHWFNLTDLPWDQMETNDKLWLLTLLTTRKNIDAYLTFDQDNNQLPESYINWK